MFFIGCFKAGASECKLAAWRVRFCLPVTIIFILDTEKTDMGALNRLTTKYIDTEDRIKLSGDRADGQELIIWLTQRLANRLVDHLTQWLEKQDVPVCSYAVPPKREAGPDSDNRGKEKDSATPITSNQQQLGAADTVLQKPEIWLINSIDITRSSQGVRLIFKGKKPGQQIASFSMSAQSLSQWLDILYEQYGKAQWPVESWPRWMQAGQITPRQMEDVVWH